MSTVRHRVGFQTNGAAEENVPVGMCARVDDTYCFTLLLLFCHDVLQLPHSNIIVYNIENFEVKFLMANKKMNVIINCLEGEDFYATIRVIAEFGRFFQLTKNDMKKKYKMGRHTLQYEFDYVF